MRSRNTATHELLAFVALAAGALTLLTAPERAEACGGFFCNAARPVNQAAERIVFAKEADGSVTAIIEVKYDGPSENFAWLLPVEGSPEVGVSSTTALDRLQRATNPSYRLNVRMEGECDMPEFVAAPDGMSVGGGVGDAGARSDGSGVTVVDRGTVGPYDYVVISVDEMRDDQVGVAVEWLRDNGYDVTEAMASTLRPYLASGQNLIAFRLTKGASTGSIRPITLTFGTGLPAIPIRPTAVAANDDMGVLVWVLGPHRAYPVNYRSLVLNEALIDWFNPSRNYDEVVSAAADEAGGQGFVTEFADDPDPVSGRIFFEWERAQWESFASRGASTPVAELVLEFLNQFGTWDGVRDLLARTLDLSSDQLDEFLQCPGCAVTGDPTGWIGEHLREGVTADSFLDDARALVIEPVEGFIEVLQRHPWMTRMYTTMSPEEMTLDPMFDFSERLPVVSNVHVADQIIECSPGLTPSEAPWRIVLPDGQVIRGEGGTSWPFEGPESADMPANAEIERVGADGSTTVADNRSAIRDRIEEHNARVAARLSGRAAGGGGCSLGTVASTASPAGWMLLGLLGLALRRRRIG